MFAIIWLFLLSCLTQSEEHYKYCSDIYPTILITKPVKKASWDIRPDIRICPDTHVDPARLSRAKNYWERLGYKFGSIIVEKDRSRCYPTRGPQREITIAIPNQDLHSKYLAMTRITTHTVSGEIVQATIYITPKVADRARVLEHELGHALGWVHYGQHSHIMNPDWNSGGYDSHGLRK